MRTPIALALLAVVATLSSAQAQAQTPAVSAPTGQKTLAATMNVYVFPNTGQSATQQSTDESACYNWAVQNTGTDPFQIANQEQQQQQQTAQQMQQAQQAGQGTAAKGAVGGAAVGALIGSIGGNAGKGAVWGAGAGLLGGAAKSKSQEAQATQQAQQQGQAASQALAGQLDYFKKAFSVCLEAKKYLVKY